jgi:hypothetical protein
VSSWAHKKGLLPALVFAAGLVMAGIVYAEIRARPIIGGHVVPPVATADIHLPASTVVRQAMPGKTSFAAIVERPLFSTSRRPKSKQVTPVPTPSLDFSLSGIVTSTNEPVALVKLGAGSGDPQGVREGETISGWTVARIEADRITVRLDVMERELLLDFAAPAPPPPPEAITPSDAQPYQQPGEQAAPQDRKDDDPEQYPQSAPQTEPEEDIDKAASN